MRYRENLSVSRVLEWLKEQNCPISLRTYHEFITRVLYRLALDHAKELGVDVDLLRAVRVRYKLPVEPQRVRGVISKQRPPHNSRAKRRKIGLPRKPKLAVNPPTVANVGRPTRADAAQLPLLGLDADTAPPQIRGDVSRPETLRYSDWQIINESARSKLAKQSRQVMTNDAGTVYHLRTGKQYTEEDLVREFGLTPTEAQSCFLTLDG